MTARNEFISGLIMLVVSIVFYIAALKIEADPFGVGLEPYTFPKAICYMILALIALLLVNSGRKLTRNDFRLGDATELRLLYLWVLPMSVISFGYIGLITLVQYPLATAVALSASLAIFGNRGRKWLVIIPCISAIIYYVIFFGVFRLLEPTGLLIEYDNYYLFGPMHKLLGT